METVMMQRDINILKKFQNKPWSGHVLERFCEIFRKNSQSIFL